MSSATSIRRLGLLAVMASLTLLAVQAPAQFVWTGTASSNWSVTTNWTGGAVPTPGATTSITFGDGTYTATNNIGATPFLLNSLTFNNTGTGANAVTIAGADPINNGLNFGGTNPTITKGSGDVNITSAITLGANLTTAGGAGTLTFANTVNDNGGGFNVIKSGTGPLVFSSTGSSSFSQLSLQAGTTSVTAGTLSLTGGGSSSTASGLQLGSASGQTATFTASGGAQIDVSENVFIGDAAGSTGTINVTGAGTVLNNTIGGTSGRFGVGNNGNGSLNITNGGAVISRAVSGNRLGGTTSSILVDGAGSSLTLIAEGLLGAQLLVSGGPASTATMTVSNGGSVNVAGNTFVATVLGSTGTLTITGPTSTFTSSGVMIIGGGSSPGGNGILNITNGATVTNAGLTIGQNTSSVSTSLIDASTVTVNGQFALGLDVGSTGSMTVQNGATVTINGSAFLGGTGATAGPPPVPDGVGNLTIKGLGTTVTGTGFFIVGGGATPGGTGNVTVSNGATLSVVNFTLGQNAASTGTAVVNDGTLAASNFLQVGSAGNGTLSILNGGKVVAGGVGATAQTAGVNGNITVSGFGSSLTVFGQTLVGGNLSDGSAGGTSSITGNDGTNVNLAGAVFLYGGGTLNVNTGVLGSYTVGGLGDGIGGATPSVGAVVTTAGSTFTINTSGTNIQFDGVISGAGGITKTGLGTQFLAGGVNTFTGPINLNGGVLNFGVAADLGASTAINFNGGTLQYGGANTTDISTLTVTILAGGATIDTGSNNVTYANSIGNNLAGTGLSGALTKVGTGTLTLTPAAVGGATDGFNTYTGGTNIQNGTVSVASDLALGVLNIGTAAAPQFVEGGNVTGTAAGTLLFTGTTPTLRSFSMGGGTIAVTTGQTVTFTGSQVSGATLDGAGTFATDATAGAQFIGVTSTPSVTITSNSPADQFVHFINGGAFTVPSGVNPTGTSSTVNLNGFTNQGSGTVTIGTAPIGGVSQAPSQINVSNFQSYGVLTLNPAPNTPATPQATEFTNVGTSPLFFNGGSRTFVGTPATATSGGQPTFVAGINLDGKNLVIAGGLFVNNGFVSDFSASQGKIIVDFGSLYKGAGFTGVSIVTQNGGKVQAGNSPGSASYGQFVLGPGGVNNYVFAIDNAAGTAGPSPDASGLVSGWGLINAIKHSLGSTMSSGNFTWTATPSSPVTVAIDTLVNPTMVGTDVNGAMANFNPNGAYSWPAVEWTGTYSGPTNVAALDAGTHFDTSGFANPIAGTFGWSLDTGDQTLSLTYTPSAVPEPGTLALTALAGLGLVRSVRRRRKSKAHA